MILHIEFSDNSNPWISLPGDRQTIAKQWRHWVKAHPLYTCFPSVRMGDYHLGVIGGNDSLYPLRYVVSRGKGNNHVEIGRYKHLGNALRWMEYHAAKGDNT